MYLTQLSNAMWYHSSGNSLSVSTSHPPLGKLGSKCWGYPIVHRQLPPMVISPSLKEVSNQVTCPLSTSIFSSRKTTGTYWQSLYYFHAIMKYETWAPSMHWPWIVKNSKQSPSFSPGKLEIFKAIPFPLQGYDIININIISSQCHDQHQHHFISISSTSQAITFHINTYKFMFGIHIPQVFEQHKSHTTTIYNITRLIFWAMVYKTNSYGHLKFNKEVNRRTNIKFWAESPL